MRSIDRQAATCSNGAQGENDPRLLEEVARSYPVAAGRARLAARPGPAARGRAERPAEAAHAYKRLLAVAPDDARRGRALWGLARAYEAQRLWVPARDTYVQAQTRFADVTVEASSAPRRNWRSSSPSGWRSAPFDRMAGDRAEPSLPVPLVRRWSAPVTDAVRPLGGGGGAPVGRSRAGSSWSKGHTIRPVDPATGEAALVGRPRRRAGLGRLPRRQDHRRDRDRRWSALGLDKGTIEWQYDLARPDARGAPRRRTRSPGPTAERRPRGERTPRLRIVGTGFRIVGDRDLLPPRRPRAAGLRRRQRPGRLVVRPALRDDQPEPLRRPAADRAPGPRSPNALVVLETATGRRRAEFPQSEDEEWPRPPLPIDDDHVALVRRPPDRRAVRPVAAARNAWVFRESDELPTQRPPAAVRRRRAAAGDPRRQRADPARRRHGGQALVAPARGRGPERAARGDRARRRARATGRARQTPHGAARSPTARCSGASPCRARARAGRSP